jgi:hypothetical protein
VPKNNAQESLTDPDSWIMKHGNGAFEQSHNGHTAVDADKQIIVAAELSQCAADSDRLAVLLDAVQADLGALPQQSLADAGFRSEAILEQLAGVPCELIVALGREGRESARVDARKYPRTAAMAARLQTAAVKEAYRKRKHIVEPPMAGSRRSSGSGSSACAASTRQGPSGSWSAWP